MLAAPATRRAGEEIGPASPDGVSHDTGGDLVGPRTCTHVQCEVTAEAMLSTGHENVPTYSVAFMFV